MQIRELMVETKFANFLSVIDFVIAMIIFYLNKLYALACDSTNVYIVHT